MLDAPGSHANRGLDRQDNKCLVAGVLREEAIIHCSLRRIMGASGGTRMRQIGHPAAYAVLTP
eukprot:1761958-Alexandrium_andersonii.AAC.1